MGRKDSDYLLNLQEEIENSAFFNQMFGYVGECGYLCSVHFEKSKTKADNNRKVPGIWSKKKIVSLAYWGKSD